ncbi:MAG: hypothetical protein ACD_28C00150G0001 [uncultured bacterium]|nr:MAG: hypothetical protein ACD_28C00150G0001 [uncultured bacterium]
MTYLERGGKKFLSISIILWGFLQILHSNYATLVLVLLSFYSLEEELFQKNSHHRRRVLITGMMHLLIYIAAFFYYYALVQDHTPIDTFFSGYSGVWSIAKNNAHGVMVWAVAVSLMTFYGVFKYFKPRIINTLEAEAKEIISFSFKDFSFYGWSLIAGFILIPTFFSQRTLEVMKAVFLNGDWARIENVPLIFLGLFSIPTLLHLRQWSSLLRWAVYPFLLMIFTAVVVRRIPGLAENGQHLLRPVFSILDFSLPFVVLMASYGFYILFRYQRKGVSIFVAAIVVFGLVKMSLLAQYEHAYSWKNNDKDFVAAYEWLEPQLVRGEIVGSNFEYLRSLHYVSENQLITTMNPQALAQINIEAFIVTRHWDYFIYKPWVFEIYPEAKWNKELENSTELVKIYEKGDTQIYKTR